ncbi:hypothetical protein NKI86_32130, partial [Mesorhizobium sp. M0320]|uniref:hypothetical protein n=1 Tax=Mesorhizobium sp. M0320 TaxID=2956936 RepID=UPI003339E0F5
MSSNLRSPAPAAVNQLAAGRRNTLVVSGSRKASGTVVYGANLVAGNSVTINGVVFAAVAAGAIGNQFNLGASLTLTLDALAAKLNASVDPKVSVATYSNVAGTTLNVSYDVAGTVGNAMTLAASIGTVSGAKLTGGTDASK